MMAGRQNLCYQVHGGGGSLPPAGMLDSMAPRSCAVLVLEVFFAM